MTNAVKREWKNLVTLNDNNEVIDMAPNKAEKVSDVPENIFKLSNKAIRETLINRRNTTVCSVGFWNRKYDTYILNYFGIAITASKESRLRLLHFKIFHNIYPTNILLYKMKIKATNKCEYCKTFDFIEHFFFHCQKLQGYWKHVETVIFSKVNEKIVIKEKVALFGVLSSDLFEVKDKCIDNINMSLLVAKMCISKAKYRKLNNPTIIIIRHRNGFKRNIF